MLQEEIKKEPCPVIETPVKRMEVKEVQPPESEKISILEEGMEVETKLRKEEEVETPFNEVESELEKMFAGIVEPAEESVQSKVNIKKGKRGKKKGRPEGSKNKKLRNKRHDPKPLKKPKREKPSSNDSLLSSGMLNHPKSISIRSPINHFVNTK